MESQEVTEPTVDGHLRTRELGNGRLENIGTRQGDLSSLNKNHSYTINTDLPTFCEIKAEDLPPFDKKNAEHFYARKI